jgi:polysaccharide pyruvyl transferase WcaK-like protein
MSAAATDRLVADAATGAPTPAERAFAASADPDATFCAQLAHALAQCRPAPLPPRDWRTEPFRPLLLGYTGKGNVGADVRVREIVRQLQAVFAHVAFAPRLATMGATRIDPVLDTLDALPLGRYFPDLMAAELARSDGVIAVEGSMFTSKFSDLLSATFAGGIGYARRQGRLAIGYGAESGRMSAALERFVQHACADAPLVSRSAATHAQLSALGLDSRLGADSAWTYEPTPRGRDAVRLALRARGWDGRAPVAVVCPMDPFCWPVKPDFARFEALKAHGLHADEQYDGVLFHAAPAGAAMRLETYLQALAASVRHLRGLGHFVVLVGMETLDGRACAKLAAKLDRPIAAFVSGRCNAETIVSVLQQAALVVTSRFHASVLALAGRVPTLGIALDERIRNLFTENGLGEWFVACDAPDLGARLVDGIDRLRVADVDATIVHLVQGQVRRFGGMGLVLHDAVRRVHPDFPESPLPRTWRAFLPPLSPRHEALLDGVG